MKRYSRRKRADSSSAPQSDNFDNLIGWIANEFIQSVVEGYELGISIEDIAKEWEVPEEAVIQILINKGIKIRERE